MARVVKATRVTKVAVAKKTTVGKVMGGRG